MNEIVNQGTYEEFKNEVGRELHKASESFVRIGYLLKVARDTDILKESGYATVTDFAKAEFGIDKSQVSRFIAINDKYSVGGYGESLDNKYSAYGYAKLVLMLNLSEEIVEEIPDTLSKTDVQAIKEEVEEEEKISDIEVAIEAADATEPKKAAGLLECDTLMKKFLWQFGKENPHIFKKLWKITEHENTENWEKETKELLAPAGDAVHFVRIPGIGRLMMTIRDDHVSITNVREGAKEIYRVEHIAKDFDSLVPLEPEIAEKAFLEMYGEEMAANVEMPKAESVSEGEKPKIPEKRKESKVTKAKKPEMPKAEAHSENIEEEVEEQLPGQMSVEDYPELLPDDQNDENRTETEENCTESEKNAQEEPESVHKEPENVQEEEEPEQITNAEIMNPPASAVERGYKAAVTNNISRLQSLWSSNSEDKLDSMIEITRDLLWRLERLQAEEKG